MVRTNRSKSGASNVKVSVYLTKEEKQQAEAIAGNLSLSEHFRRSGLKLRRPAVVPEVNRQAYTELSKVRLDLVRVGSNLNQLTRSSKICAEQGQLSSELVKQISSAIASLEAVTAGLNQVQVDLIAPEVRKPYGVDEAES